MWGPTALLMGKLEFFVLPLSDSGQFLCNSSLAHQAADLVSVSGGQKGSEAITRGVCSGMTCPPRPSLTLSSFYGRPPAGGEGDNILAQCIIAPLSCHNLQLWHMSNRCCRCPPQPHMVQFGAIALMHKNPRGILGYSVWGCLVHYGEEVTRSVSSAAQALCIDGSPCSRSLGSDLCGLQFGSGCQWFHQNQVTSWCTQFI